MKKRNSSAGAVVFCVLFVVFLIFLFEIHLSSVSEFYSLRSTKISQGSGHSERLVPRKIKRAPLPPTLPVGTLHGGEITCDRSHTSYDLCSINAPTLLDPATSTFYLMGPISAASPPTVEKIRPYPRKAENHTMSRIKELTLTSNQWDGPQCKVQHSAPAVVFSAGGYTGNFFHDINDGFFPLFITVNSVFPDQEFILVVSKARDWWVSKYADLLGAFSKHRIIDLDNDRSTHCFTSATVGLISHGFMTIDPNATPNSKTLLDFHYFLGKAFSHDPIPNSNQTSLSNPSLTRPRMVLVTRPGNIGREILNQNKAKRIAEDIGFDVIVFEPTDKTRLNDAYALINSRHAMVGVHGAALTHLVFLRPGSAMVQVVPLGLEWAAEVCYEKPAREIGLEYVEYRIDVEESSLVEKYGRDDLVIKDPVAVRGLNWSNMKVYLKEQNVRLDLVRFRECLKEVFKKAKALMDKKI